MALNASALGQAMASAAEEEAKKEGATPQTIWTAVATEIVNHITSNAEVNVNVSTTGSSSAQTGTGTGKIL